MKIYRLSDKYEKQIQTHIDGVNNADISDPVFVTEQMEIVDGAHRTAKAFIEKKMIPYIMLSQEELNKTILDKDENYIGQVYVDDSDIEYSVKKIMKLYKNRKPKMIDPKDIIENSPKAWGNMGIEDILEKMK